jgi:hypothetical protein
LAVFFEQNSFPSGFRVLHQTNSSELLKGYAVLTSITARRRSAFLCGFAASSMGSSVRGVKAAPMAICHCNNVQLSVCSGSGSLPRLSAAVLPAAPMLQ